MHLARFLILPALIAVAACDVDEQGQYTTSATAREQAAPVAVAPASVQLLAGAPTRAYTVVETLNVTVNKLTAFHPNPTKEAVEARLRAEAARLGANAVIEVEISEVQVSPISWGTRTGKGIAVRF